MSMALHRSRLLAAFTAAFRRRDVVRKSRRPPEILYGIDDRPPAAATLLSAAQHVGNIATSIAAPVIVLHEAHVPAAVASTTLAVAFLGLAVAVILQALPRGPLGSGFLAPSTFATSLTGPSLAALSVGGLPMVFGMTVFAGLVQVCVSRFMRHLRPFLPPEVAGTVTFLLGIGIAAAGMRELLGLGQPGAVPPAHWLVAGFTLTVIFILNIWTAGLLRISCVLVGLLLGYIAALTTGLLPLHVLTNNAAPAFALPHLTMPHLAFSPLLTVPFLLTALISVIKAIAVITACQRTNDAAYVRPDLRAIKRGVLADGVVLALSGLLGTPGFNIAPSSSGLAAATGVTSRRVAFAIALLLALLAFSPAADNLLAAIPDAVAGAILVFSSCSVITSGVEVMASRLLDTRRVLVVAAAIIAANEAPNIATSIPALPAAVQQVAASPLLLGTMVALALNVLVRRWGRRNSVLDVDPAAPDPDAVQRFMDGCGAAWGARPAIIQRANFALVELVDAVARNALAQGRIRIQANFTEFRVHLRLSYDGAAMPLPQTRPGVDEIADSEDGLLRLSGHLVRRQADRVRSARNGATCTVELDFDH